VLGQHGTAVRNMLRRSLEKDSCKFIISISEYAQRRSAFSGRDWAAYDEIMASKGRMLLPAVRARPSPNKRYDSGRISVVFVGAHWARKGGVVATRLAGMAHRSGAPIDVTIVSVMKYGLSVYTDAADKRLYSHDIKAMYSLPNVRHESKLSNQRVLELLSAADFSLLPTVHDTFGYSILESMSVGTPVIATGTGAIPEIVTDNQNGFILPVETNEIGDWVHARSRDWEKLDDFYSLMAHQTFERLTNLIDQPGERERLSLGCGLTIRDRFSIERLHASLEALYSDVIKLLKLGFEEAQ
jgi:glycosyltransferase involved in cell wall biosynthesis